MSADFIKRQLEIVKGLMGYRYGDGDIDARVTEEIARKLSDYGVTDIRHFGRVEDSLDIDCQQYGGHSGILRGFHFINKNTGQSLTQPFYTSFTGTGLYEDASYGSSGGFYCGGANDYTYEWDGRFDNYLGDAGNTGDYRIQIFVKFLDSGIPIFYTQLLNTQGMGFGNALKELATIILAAATFAVPGVNAAIAGSIFGPLAAAYPALTAAATNVMLTTALNGGDVEAAVKNVVASYVGQSSGQLVSGLSDSAAAGRLAAAAVTAAARGSDVERAIATTALQIAPSLIDTEPVSVPLPEPVTYHDPVYDSPTVTPAVEPNMSIFDVPIEPPAVYDDFAGSFDFAVGGDVSGFDLPVLPLDLSGDPMFDSTALGTDFSSTSVPLSPGVLSPLESDPVSTFSDSSVTDIPTFIPTSAPTFQPLSSDESFSGVTEGSSADSGSSFFGDVSFRDVVQGISDTALALLRVNQAYRAAGSPSVQPAVRTSISGANQTVRADGTVATVDPITGVTTVNRAPVGVPYVLPTGAIVTNNGDGTYTTISSSGARVSQYAPITSTVPGSLLTGSTFVQGVPDWALIGGGALALALLLKR